MAKFHLSTDKDTNSDLTFRLSIYKTSIAQGYVIAADIKVNMCVVELRVQDGIAI